MANSYIDFDTKTLRDYAKRINDVKRRIRNLDTRIEKLFSNFVNMNSYNEIRIDLYENNGWKLEKCANYLNETAYDFENIERQIASGNISNTKNTKKNASNIGSNKNKIIQILSKLFGMSFNSYSSRTKDSIIFNLGASYASIIEEYVGDKVNAYLENITNSENLRGAFVGVYDWFQDELLEDFDFLEDIGEELGLIEELPENVDNSLKILKYGDLLIDNIKLVGEGIMTGDWSNLEEVAYKDLGQAFSEIDKVISGKQTGITKLSKGILLKTITKMPTNWINSIRDYAENGTGTAGSIVFDSTLGAAAEVVASELEPLYKTATAVTYPLIDQICEAVGYDLSAEYERLTGETGLTAVFSAQKELWVDIVGGGIRDAVSTGLDNAYDWIGNTWNGTIGKLFN